MLFDIGLQRVYFNSWDNCFIDESVARVEEWTLAAPSDAFSKT